MKSALEVILFCILFFSSKFVVSVSYSEDRIQHRAYQPSNWPGNQNAPIQFQNTGFAQTQNENSFQNSAHNVKSQEYNANEPRDSYTNVYNNPSSFPPASNKRLVKNIRPIQHKRELPTVDTYPYSIDGPKVKLDNQPYRNHYQQSQVPYPDFPFNRNPSNKQDTLRDQAKNSYVEFIPPLSEEYYRPDNANLKKQQYQSEENSNNKRYIANFGPDINPSGISSKNSGKSYNAESVVQETKSKDKKYLQKVDTFQTYNNNFQEYTGNSEALKVNFENSKYVNNYESNSRDKPRNLSPAHTNNKSPGLPDGIFEDQSKDSKFIDNPNIPAKIPDILANKPDSRTFTDNNWEDFKYRDLAPRRTIDRVSAGTPDKLSYKFDNNSVKENSGYPTTGNNYNETPNLLTNESQNRRFSDSYRADSKYHYRKPSNTVYNNAPAVTLDHVANKHENGRYTDNKRLDSGYINILPNNNDNNVPSAAHDIFTNKPQNKRFADIYRDDYIYRDFAPDTTYNNAPVATANKPKNGIYPDNSRLDLDGYINTPPGNINNNAPAVKPNIFEKKPLNNRFDDIYRADSTNQDLTLDNIYDTAPGVTPNNVANKPESVPFTDNRAASEYSDLTLDNTYHKIPALKPNIFTGKAQSTEYEEYNRPAFDYRDLTPSNTNIASAVKPNIFKNKPQSNDYNDNDRTISEYRHLTSGNYKKKAPAVKPNIFENQTQGNKVKSIVASEYRDLSFGTYNNAPDEIPDTFEFSDHKPTGRLLGGDLSNSKVRKTLPNNTRHDAPNILSKVAKPNSGKSKLKNVEPLHIPLIPSNKTKLDQIVGYHSASGVQTYSLKNVMSNNSSFVILHSNGTVENVDSLDATQNALKDDAVDKEVDTAQLFTNVPQKIGTTKVEPLDDKISSQNINAPVNSSNPKTVSLVSIDTKYNSSSTGRPKIEPQTPSILNKPVKKKTLSQVLSNFTDVVTPPSSKVAAIDSSLLSPIELVIDNYSTETTTSRPDNEPTTVDVVTHAYSKDEKVKENQSPSFKDFLNKTQNDSTSTVAPTTSVSPNNNGNRRNVREEILNENNSTQSNNKTIVIQKLNKLNDTRTGHDSATSGNKTVESKPAAVGVKVSLNKDVNSEDDSITIAVDVPEGRDLYKNGRTIVVNIDTKNRTKASTKHVSNKIEALSKFKGKFKQHETLEDELIDDYSPYRDSENCVIYYFELQPPPVVEKQTQTTTYPNGTVITVKTETIYEYPDDTSTAAFEII